MKYDAGVQISKQKVNSTLEKQLYQTLFQMFADLKTVEDSEIVMRDFFSDTELVTLAKRLAVAYWLTKKRSYENIKSNLKVSSATVADVQANLHKRGWKLALKKIMAEEWASKMEDKIKTLFRRK